MDSDRDSVVSGNYTPPYRNTVDMDSDDGDMFPPNVSGFEPEDDDDDDVRSRSIDGDPNAEESELDESKLDDAQRENAAVQMYNDFHPDLEQRKVGGREIAQHEAIWSVSSFRPHWGPDKLRDNDALTYWQSDCPNPRKNHTIDLAFHQATLIRQVSVFIDYYQDESYTPKTISIRGGTTYRDLHVSVGTSCREREMKRFLIQSIIGNYDD